MTFGQLSVLTAGLLWMCSGSICMEISRLLGPSFDRTTTAHPVLRFAFWLIAATFFARGVSLLFPGEAIDTSRISIMAPWSAAGTLALCLIVLDWTMRDRAPPPWSTRLLARFGLRSLIASTGGSGEVEVFEAPRDRAVRLAVLVLASLGLFALALLLALNAHLERGG